MAEPIGKFAFLTRKEVIAFLRVMFSELRKLTLRDGFSGVRSAMDTAIVELKKVKEIPEKPPIVPKPE